MAIVGMVAAVVGVVCSSDRGVAIMIVTGMGVTTAGSGGRTRAMQQP